MLFCYLNHKVYVFRGKRGQRFERLSWEQVNSECHSLALGWMQTRMLEAGGINMLQQHHKEHHLRTPPNKVFSSIWNMLNISLGTKVIHRRLSYLCLYSA